MLEIFGIKSNQIKSNQYKIECDSTKKNSTLNVSLFIFFGFPEISWVCSKKKQGFGNIATEFERGVHGHISTRK